MAPGLSYDIIALPDDIPTKLRDPQESLVEWPDFLNSMLAWDCRFIRQPEDAIHDLSDADLNEVEQGLIEFKLKGCYGSDASTSTFPLPSLGNRLSTMAKALHDRTGYCLVRGLDLTRLSYEDSIVVFLGISSYLGDERAMQDKNGNMITHITNLHQHACSEPERPLRYSNRHAFFHTDEKCDIVALLCRGVPEVGGDHYLASSWNVYNRICESRPDLIQILAEPNWPIDANGNITRGERRPLLFFHEGRIILNFNRQALTPFEGSPRSKHLADLSPRQLDALDAIETIAEQGKLSLSLQPGDMLFVNNHAILHSRQAFQDSSKNTRYLQRIWIRNSTHAWELPPILRYDNERMRKFGRHTEKWNLRVDPHVTFSHNDRLGQ